MFLGCSLLVPSLRLLSFPPPRPNTPASTVALYSTDAGRMIKVTTALRVCESGLRREYESAHPEAQKPCYITWRTDRPPNPGNHVHNWNSNLRFDPADVTAGGCSFSENSTGNLQDSADFCSTLHPQPSNLNHFHHSPASHHRINARYHRVGSPSPALRQCNPERTVSLSPALSRQEIRGGGPTLWKHRLRLPTPPT
jgi:hypothetical protein